MTPLDRYFLLFGQPDQFFPEHLAQPFLFLCRRVFRIIADGVAEGDGALFLIGIEGNELAALTATATACATCKGAIRWWRRFRGK